MTNMTDLIQTSAEVANQSPWAWLIGMFIGWLGVSAYGIKYTTKRLEESSAKLLASEQEKVNLMRTLTEEKDALHKAHYDELMKIIRDQTLVSQQMVSALDKLEKAILR